MIVGVVSDGESGIALMGTFSNTTRPGTDHYDGKRLNEQRWVEGDEQTTDVSSSLRKHRTRNETKRIDRWTE